MGEGVSSDGVPDEIEDAMNVQPTLMMRKNVTPSTQIRASSDPHRRTMRVPLSRRTYRMRKSALSWSLRESTNGREDSKESIWDEIDKINLGMWGLS